MPVSCWIAWPRVCTCRARSGNTAIALITVIRVPTQRERKRNYDVNEYYREAMATQQDNKVKREVSGNLGRTNLKGYIYELMAWRSVSTEDSRRRNRARAGRIRAGCARPSAPTRAGPSQAPPPRGAARRSVVVLLDRGKSVVVLLDQGARLFFLHCVLAA